MNTELQAMIDAGRKLIAEQATAEQRKTAHAVAVPGAVDRPGAALIAVAHALSQAKRPAVAVTP